MDCKRCGQCCKTIYFSPDLEDVDLEKSDMDHKEFTLIKRIMKPIGEWEDGHTKYKCRMLYIDDNDKAHCIIYESRPAVCRRFTPGEDGGCEIKVDKED